MGHEAVLPIQHHQELIRDQAASTGAVVIPEVAEQVIPAAVGLLQAEAQDQGHPHHQEAQEVAGGNNNCD